MKLVFDGVTLRRFELSGLNVTDDSISAEGLVTGREWVAMISGMLSAHSPGDVVVFECEDDAGRELEGVGTIAELKMERSEGAEGTPGLRFRIVLLFGVH